MIQIDNRIFLNLPEQVEKNKKDIEELKGSSGGSSKLYLHVLDIDGQRQGGDRITVKLSWYSTSSTPVESVDDIPQIWFCGVSGQEFMSEQYINLCVKFNHLNDEFSYGGFALGGENVVYVSPTSQTESITEIFKNEYSSYTFTDEVVEL